MLFEVDPTILKEIADLKAKSGAFADVIADEDTSEVNLGGRAIVDIAGMNHILDALPYALNLHTLG